MVGSMSSMCVALGGGIEDEGICCEHMPSEGMLCAGVEQGRVLCAKQGCVLCAGALSSDDRGFA